MLSTQTSFNQNSYEEGFLCDNPRLARLLYVNTFQDGRPQWLSLRYEEKDVKYADIFFYLKHQEE